MILVVLVLVAPVAVGVGVSTISAITSIIEIIISKAIPIPSFKKQICRGHTKEGQSETWA